MFDLLLSGLPKTSLRELPIDPCPPVSGEEASCEGLVGGQSEYSRPDHERSGRGGRIGLADGMPEAGYPKHDGRHREDEEGTSDDHWGEEPPESRRHMGSIGTTRSHP